MSAYRLTTPSRLHFGLLAYGPQAPRQFGGVGLMIDHPGLDLTVRTSTTWSAEGPLADRVLRFAERISTGLRNRGIAVPLARFEIHRGPSEHVGLGTGTQLGLAVARLISALAGYPDLPVSTLAELSGRGLRSGIGLHGFNHGGLIVDGGRRSGNGLPPLLARMPWPDDWAILVLLPRQVPGLHGSAESRAFAELSPMPEAITERLCRILLLGLLPSLAEQDLEAFGNFLSQFQLLIGKSFAMVQGGLYAHPDLQSIADWLRDQGLQGVGQSSWGPALYAYSQQPIEARDALRTQACQTFQIDPSSIFWTSGNNQGAVVEERPE